MCEAWTITSAVSMKIKAFEMKCYRNVLCVSWAEKISNVKVSTRIDFYMSAVLQCVEQLRLTCFVHITFGEHIFETKQLCRRRKRKMKVIDKMATRHKRVTWNNSNRSGQNGKRSRVFCKKVR